MNLKVGDKVRIVKFPDKGCVGMVCNIISIEVDNAPCCCRVKQMSTHWNCLMFADEIEKVVIKGQQLLFSFME